MMKRPFCLLFAVMACLILLCNLLGISWIWRSPQGEWPFEWAARTPTVRVSGKVTQVDTLEGTYSSATYLILTSSSLYHQSDIYSLRDMKCYLQTKTELKPGARVVLQGTLSCPARATNPGEFDTCRYEQSQKVDFYLKDAEILSVTPEENLLPMWREAIKEECRRRLNDLFPETEAGILSAMLLGDKSDLEDSVREKYQAAGISHILAISGVKMLSLVSLDTS